MRGADEVTGALFSYVSLEERIPARHPLRKVREIVNDALASLDTEFDRLYSSEGRPSIAPERLVRASLIQILFLVRSERQLMEQMHYNLLFRWFVGLGIDDPVWVCCQTNANSSQCSLLGSSQAVPSWRHSTRAAVRLSLKCWRRERLRSWLKWLETEAWTAAKS